MTIQGIGASLSSGLGGIIAKNYGYQHAFFVLAFIALVGLLFWMFISPSMSKYKTSYFLNRKSYF